MQGGAFAGYPTDTLIRWYGEWLRVATYPIPGALNPDLHLAQALQQVFAELVHRGGLTIAIENLFEKIR